MVRNLIAGLGTLSLFFMLAGCCEDKECPVGDASVDLLVDAPGEPQEAGEDTIAIDEGIAKDGVEGDGPVNCEPMDLSGTITISQLISDVPGDTRFFFSFAPIFEDLNNPINEPQAGSTDLFKCYAFTWTGNADMTRSTEDAGDVSITGHKTPQYDDGSGTLQSMPSTVTCERKKVAGGSVYTYDCGLGSQPMLESEAFDDNTLIDFSSTGGPCIPALSDEDLPTGIETKPDPSFDLNNVDPGAGITAKWLTPAPAVAAISILIHDKNETKFTSMACSAMGMSKSVEIPQDVLDAAPKPTAGNPIQVRTSLIGFTPGGKTDTWGTYKVGVGRGHFGVTCVTTTGATPGPCP